MGRMSGKVAVITGANSGVGKAAALLFAKEGASVVIAARRAKMLEEVAEQITAAGGEVLCVPTDISNADDVKKLIGAAVEKYGHLDAMVNAASVVEDGLKPIDRFVEDELDFVFSINTKGTMLCMREAANVMKNQETLGAIVNVASVAGTVGTSCASYTASKGAVVSVTKNSALRFTGSNIRVNCVCPGGINTPMLSGNGVAPDADMWDALTKHCDFSIGVYEPEDVANLLLFLSSDESRYINGQIITIDRGTNL